MLNRRMPNGTYGGVRGERISPLLDCLKTWKKTSGSTGGREKALAIEKPPWYNSKSSGNRITKNTKEVFNNGKEKHK